MTSPTHARKARLKTHLVSAKAKLKNHVTPRRVVLLSAAACSAILLLLTIRTLHSAASRGASRSESGTASTPAAVAGVKHAQQPRDDQQRRECGKVPAPVTEALVHYATSSNETPRQTEAEAGVAARVLARRGPCNVLVLGLGPGSALWAAINHGGRTLFLEPDAARIAAARAAHPAGIDLQTHPVTYQQQAASGATITDDLLALRNSSDCAADSPPKPLAPEHLERSPCALAPRGLPAAFYEAVWDVVMVDAPPVPGAVYTAAVVARARRPGTGETDVLVHGVDGAAEESFARAFLCDGYFKEEAGRLRHFSVPSHRDKDTMPFCP